MASAQRVIDFMSNMPDASNHMLKFKSSITEREDSNMEKYVDGLNEEKKWLGAGERMLISNLHCQVKFTRRAFKEGINVRVQSSAKGHSGEGQITRYSINTVSFNCKSRPWWLRPSLAYVRYTEASADSFTSAYTLRNKILSRCTTLSSGEADAMNLKVIQRKLSSRADMRHMFVKMFLTLMDYNLSVTSKEDMIDVDEDINMQNVAHGNLTQAERLVLTANHEIVVDSTGMTPRELGLLSLASKAYPSVWYCGDNIYNNVQMEPDDLVILSDYEVRMDTSLQWGSPDRLLHTIWSLACKMGATECMADAFSMMRGQCRIMDKIFSYVRDQNCVNMMVPKSSSLTRALDIDSGVKPTSSPAFMSTSMSLLSDLLTGDMLECSATCVVEELGGIGKALSSATPSTSRTYNGLLRDYGVEHSDPTINILLQNWFSITGRTMSWGYGRLLKLYLIELTTAMVNGWDVDMPQLMTMIPYAHTPNTTWGYSRNWLGTSEILTLDKKRRKEESNKLAANAWLMGLRKLRPKVFRNTFSTENLSMGPFEYELEAEVRDGCTLKTAQIFISDDVGGRVDEMEKSAKGLLPTEYVGTVCSLVYDIGSDAFITRRDDVDYDRILRESFKGEKVERKSDFEAKGITAFTHGGIPKNTDKFAHLRNADSAIGIRPDKKPVHVKENAGGEGRVSPYSVNGELSSDPLPLNKPEYSTEKTYKIKEIEVEGDGSCGIHAIVEDLQSHGLIAGSEAKRAGNVFRQDARSKTFHDAEELGGLAIKWGFGLDVYDKSTNILHRLHDGKSEHHITLVRDNAHFNAGIITEDTGGSKFSSIRQNEVPNDAYLSVIEKYGSLFGDTRS